MDLRSSRRAGGHGQLFSHPRRLICGLSSTSTVQRSSWASSSACRWSTCRAGLPGWQRGSRPRAKTSPTAGPRAHLRDRNRFLHLLWTHQQRYPSQRLLLLSGDIHIGGVQELRWYGSDLRVHQIISSAITNRSGWSVRLAALLSILLNHRITTRDNRVCAAVRFLQRADDYTRCLFRKFDASKTSCLRTQASSPRVLAPWIPAFAGMTRRQEMAGYVRTGHLGIHTAA
jgi:alkaline phosphatase D